MEVLLHRESGTSLCLGKLQAMAVAAARTSGPKRNTFQLRLKQEGKNKGSSFSDILL